MLSFDFIKYILAYWEKFTTCGEIVQGI